MLTRCRACALLVALAVPAIGSAQESGIDDVVPAAAPDGPLLSWAPGGTAIRLSLMLRERVESVSGFVVDRDGNRFEPDPFADGSVRVGAHFDSRVAWAPLGLAVDYEHDLITGTQTGDTADDALAAQLPNSGGAGHELRQAALRLSLGQHVHLTGGVQTSHWGQGLVANDGAHGWEPGNASFSEPRSGDRVLRGAVMLGPFSDQGLAVVFAADAVGAFNDLDDPGVLTGDDALLEGDQAHQLIASVIWGFRQPTWAGLYGVLRQQETAAGDFTDVVVIDAAGGYERELGDGTTLSFGAELVGITGTTDLSPSVDFTENDVRQMGAALNASWDRGRWGLVFDGTWASGDSNFDDGEQTSFRIDRNHQLGMVLHRYVQGAWTARGAITAADPDLVGVPADDLDRLATRESATNLISVFPRAWVRPVDVIEIYGGPMLAWSSTDFADPFNSRIAGGDPRNALDGDPGRYLGTELDLGVRYHDELARTELSAGLEGGALFPGSGLKGPAGEGLGTLWAGRFVLAWEM